MIKTTGGTVYKNDLKKIYDVICEVFNCKPEEITNLEPLQKGISNSVLIFTLRGGQYVFRYPGNGSEVLVDRRREAMLQQQASDFGIDNTLVAMSIRDGWRIGKYIKCYPYDYHNLSHVVRGVELVRKLHSAKAKIRWEFDIKEKFESIRDLTDKEKYGENFKEYPDFANIKDRVYKLIDLTKGDNIKKCLVHGDCRDENILINDEQVNLIDWEYSGFCDPGFDIGTYVAGGDHSKEEVDRILFIYFQREPTFEEKRHFYAWIAISGFFYMHWCMFKESIGQRVGYLKPLWYRFANEYSSMALSMFEGDK